MDGLNYSQILEKSYSVEKPNWIESHAQLWGIPDTKSFVFYPHDISIVQKLVHPLSRSLGRLRVSMRSGNEGVWVWSRRQRKYASVDHPPRAMKLNTKRVAWIIRQKRKGETNTRIAQAMGVSPRWVKKIWSRYRYADVNMISYKSRAGRRVGGMYGRREHSAVLSARGNGHLGASILRARIEERSGLNIPKSVIHRVMVENGMAKEDPGKKKKRRRWVRYERTHSNSLWHTDWKQIHGGMHDGRWFLCYEDDASRFVTGYGIFDNATTENALRVLDGAIKNHGRPASIMTDHGAQFYASKRGSGGSGGSRFERRLVELGIRQILAGVGHPQTNGKVERLHGEIQRKLHEFESIMMRKSDPMDLFMRWYNYDRPHMSLNDGETPAEAFERKMAPKGERIIDEQTGEEYDAR